MKRIALAIGLAGIVIFASTVVLPDGKVRAMNVQVNVKDLAEQGVRIIAASDPSFEERAEAFFKGQPGAIVERVKPVSAILENTGSLAIVGICIKWDVLKHDGTTFSRPVSDVNPRALMDGEPKLIQTTEGAAIPPHSTRFVSILGSARAGQQLDLNRSWISFRGSSIEMEEFRNALAQGNIEDAFNLSEIGRVLAQATAITISVELVFFEDATFVGDDKSSFFEKVSADINAQYDLATEVANAQKQGRTLEEICNQVSQTAAAYSPTREATRVITSNTVKQTSEGDVESGARRYLDAYNRSKALYARAFIGMKDTLGAREAISEKLKLLERPRKQLRKRGVLTK